MSLRGGTVLCLGTMLCAGLTQCDWWMEKQRLSQREAELRAIIRVAPWVVEPPLVSQPMAAAPWPKSVELRLVLKPLVSVENPKVLPPANQGGKRRLVPNRRLLEKLPRQDVSDPAWVSLTSVATVLAEVDPDSMTKRIYTGPLELDLSESNWRNIVSSDVLLSDFGIRLVRLSDKGSRGFVIRGTQFELLGWWDGVSGELFGFAWPVGADGNDVAEWGILGGGITSEDLVLDTLSPIASSALEQWVTWSAFIQE